MDKYEMIMNYIYEMDEDALIEAWNYRYGNGKTIRYISEFDDELSHLSPTEIAELATDCDFCSWDDYFTYEDCELNTSDSIGELVDLEDLANYVINEDDDLGDEEIRAMLDAEDDEEGDE